MVVVGLNDDLLDMLEVIGCGQDSNALWFFATMPSYGENESPTAWFRWDIGKKATVLVCAIVFNSRSRSGRTAILRKFHRRFAIRVGAWDTHGW